MAAGLLGAYGGAFIVSTVSADALTSVPDTAILATLETAAGDGFERRLTNAFDGKSLSGNYLAGIFAQRHHDWAMAQKHLGVVLALTPENLTLMKRFMILSMGSGNTTDSLAMAHNILALEKDSSLALLFLSMEAFKEQNYELAARHLQAMPEGTLSELIAPILHSWTQAAQGVLDTQKLNKNTLHINHALLIADYLGEYSHIENLLQKVLDKKELALKDMEHIADIYAHIKHSDTALEIYENILTKEPNYPGITAKLEKLKKGEALTLFSPIKTPEEGIAAALYDMAQVLYRDDGDDSARIFANIALYLDPDLDDANLLLASISGRNERYDDAIAYYQNIKPESSNFIQARRRAADLLEDSGYIEEALNELQILSQNYNDLDALIQRADIYRRNEEFLKAISLYNQAQKHLGGTIPEEYWYLHYVRGMSYEQAGQWAYAEKDLEAALAFQPDHPLVLNYLGYSWADQGINLKRSLQLIRKAVSLSPSDGYITDSLGWVYYRMGKYKRALPHLEKAVELLPYDSTINDHLGDAYWQVGRKLEARFQWERAKNYSKDEAFITALTQKLDEGLHHVEIVKEARSDNAQSDHLTP